MLQWVFLLFYFFFSISAFEFDGCGEGGKICHQKCSTEECAFKLSVKQLDGKTVQFELWSPNSVNSTFNYVAMGISRDNRMGDDVVTACTNFGEDNKIINGFNFGYNFKKSNSEITELEAATVNDEDFYCRFNHPIQSEVENNKVDLLDGKYVLLMARGVAGGGSIMIHEFGTYGPTPVADDQTLAKDPNVEENSVTEESTSPSSPKTLTVSADLSRMLRRLHGAIMIVAWLFLVFCAVYAARYLREHWPNTTVRSLQLWFQIHRTLNFLGVLAIIVASVMIFIAVDFKWTGPSVNAPSDANLTAYAIHSIFGAVAVLLALLQPFGALLRCDKNDRHRPIFNVAHRSAGILGILCCCGFGIGMSNISVITLFIAVWSEDFNVMWKNHTIAVTVFTGFIIAVVALVIIQEVLKSRDQNERSRVSAMEMNSRSGNPVPSDSYYYRNRKVHSDRYNNTTVLLFSILVILSLLTVATLAYLVLISG